MLVISCFSGLGITASASTKADYYLCGYINGANYGVEEDYKNLGEYHFVDGTLTTSFTGVTWVGVKTADNSNWYFYDGKTGCTETTATLERDKSEKMFIPAGVEVTLTLVVNADGTVTLSYETGEPITEPVTEEPTTQAPTTAEPTTQAPTTPVTVVPGFYLVGSAEVCGAEWNFMTPWDNLTQMSYIGNNVYTQTFTNIPSSANAIDSTGAHRYEFKVIYVDAKGGVTWHPGGSNNSTFVTVKDDGSTLKFTFKLLAASPTTEGQYPEAVTCEVTNPYAPTTAEPTTDAPTTAQPTTQAPTTAEPTTQAPTTAEPTTQAPTTAEPTTQAPTTAEPTTQAPTTAEPTTQAPTTAEPTTQAPTTAEPTTQAPTTAEPTTQAPTTAEPTTQAPTEAPKKDISGWKVEGLKNKTYTGKVIKQNIDVVSADGEYADITVEYRNNKNPGTATVTIKGTGNYTGTISKTFKISKAAQTMTVKAETKSVKAASVKKKKVTVTKAITVKKNKGTVTYARVKSGSSKYLTISKKGVITVKKGTYKKNTVLKIKVKVTAKGTTYYNKGSQTVTVKIKVK